MKFFAPRQIEVSDVENYIERIIKRTVTMHPHEEGYLGFGASSYFTNVLREVYGEDEGFIYFLGVDKEAFVSRTLCLDAGKYSITDREVFSILEVLERSVTAIDGKSFSNLLKKINKDSLEHVFSSCQIKLFCSQGIYSILREVPTSTLDVIYDQLLERLLYVYNES